MQREAIGLLRDAIQKKDRKRIRKYRGILYYRHDIGKIDFPDVGEVICGPGYFYTLSKTAIGFVTKDK